MAQADVRRCMAERDPEGSGEGTDGPPGGRKLEEADELRTIAFRLREIQRLLGARVAQENRWLEAEGLEPVTDHDFFRFREDPDDDES